MKDKVILVGKGPSSKEVKKSKNHSIACLNNAIILCEEVDFLFINDMEVLDLIQDDQWTKVKKVIIPTYPHYNCGPHKHITHNTLLQHIPIHVDYDIHRLDTCLDKNPNIQYLGQSYSVGTTAIQWLGHNGCKKLDFCGIDPTGGYNPIFNIVNEQGHPKNHAARPEPVTAVYQVNYERFTKTADIFGIKLNRI